MWLRLILPYDFCGAKVPFKQIALSMDSKEEDCIRISLTVVTKMTIRIGLNQLKRSYSSSCSLVQNLVRVTDSYYVLTLVILSENNVYA